MPRRKYSELTAGIFVLLALGVTVGLVVWLGASDLFKRGAQRVTFYAAESDGSMGLAVGNAIQINDMPVGRISDIRSAPKGGRTLYIADVEMRDLKIHADGAAQVAKDLVGQGRLVITSRGSAAKPLADEDNPIHLTGGLDQAMSNIASVSEDLKSIAGTFKREMDVAQSAAMLAKVHGVVDDLKRAAVNIASLSSNVLAETDSQRKGSVIAKVHASADDVNRVTGSLSRELDPANPAALLAKVHRSADDLNAMTADAKPKVQRTLTAMENVATQFESFTKKDIVEILATLREVNSKVLTIVNNFSVVSEQARQMVALNRDRVDEMIDNMSQVSDNLKATSKEVRRNPWRLLYKPDKQELKSQNVSEAARAFASGAEQLDQVIIRLNALSQANPKGIAADDPELQKIRKEIQGTFGNFTKAEQALWQEMAK